MNIQTKYFDNITIEETDIFHFENGLPGFLEEKEFILLPLSDESPFQVLQSTTEKALAFVVVSPFMFKEEYEVKIPDATLDQLKIKSEQDVELLVIVSVSDPFETSTANLLAPVVLNAKEKTGKQLIISDEKYSIRYPLFERQTVEREG
jgi:flagellar assembly factor FliW